MKEKRLRPQTQARIKAALEVFVEHVVDKYRNAKPPLLAKPKQYLALTSKKGQLKPFHCAIIPAELMRINQFERGFSTSLGSTFEEVARLVALDYHERAERNYTITAEVPMAAINEIERQVSQYEHLATAKGAKPTFSGMVEAVLSADRGQTESRSSTADLFVQKRDGTELYFEIKSPQPNKGQCLEVTQRLLRTHLIRNSPRPQVQAYFAMAYNPYGPSRRDYGWTYALNYMPFDQAVVIGQEFWSMVGGPSTYSEVLEIYQEVGREKGKYIVDALAFGF